MNLHTGNLHKQPSADHDCEPFEAYPVPINRLMPFTGKWRPAQRLASEARRADMGHEARIAKNTPQPKGDGIRSVERAIEVLQALNRRPLSTLHDLHSDTGLPKPSIVRLLRTLEGLGLAAQSASYGSYQLLGRVKSLASGFHHEPEIIEVAEDLMIEFTRKQGWPLSLALFDRDAMVVRACTIRFTSLSLEHAALNRRLSLTEHAMGRAHLAFSAPNEQAILLSIIKSGQTLLDDAALARLIARVQADGYAMRDPLANPQSSTFAIPVFEHGRLLATLGFTWIAAAMSNTQAVKAFLPALRDIATQISRTLEREAAPEVETRFAGASR